MLTYTHETEFYIYNLTLSASGWVGSSNPKAGAFAKNTDTVMFGNFKSNAFKWFTTCGADLKNVISCYEYNFEIGSSSVKVFDTSLNEYVGEFESSEELTKLDCEEWLEKFYDFEGGF